MLAANTDLLHTKRGLFHAKRDLFILAYLRARVLHMKEPTYINRWILIKLHYDPTATTTHSHT